MALATAIVVVAIGLGGCGGGQPAVPAGSAASTADPEPGTRERNIVRKKLPHDVRSIALEYTVILVDASGTERAVDPAEHTFEVGNAFLVRIRPHDDLYVYVFNEGPGGERTCLLPAADEPPHLVKANAEIALPDDGGHFTFEPPAGEEKLVVVALPEPTDNVRRLAAAVFKGQAGGLRTAAATEAKQQADETLDALRAKSGAAVRTRGPVRKMVERLDGGIPAGTTVSHVEPPHDGETSSYGIAVTAADGSGPELVLDIPLRSRGGAGGK
ncbi:MAG: DUF4384 domain-containing protein [Planctomycetaceae bacterium]